MAAERGAAKVGVLARIGRLGGRMLGVIGLAGSAAQAKDSIEEYDRDIDAGVPRKEALRTQRYRWGSLEGNTPEEQKKVDEARSDSFLNWISK